MCIAFFNPRDDSQNHTHWRCPSFESCVDEQSDGKLAGPLETTGRLSHYTKVLLDS